VLTGDAVFLWAADTTFQEEIAAEALPHPLGGNLGGQTLHQLAVAVKWATSTMPPVPPAAVPAAVGVRRGLSDDPPTYNMTVEDTVALRDMHGTA
jgi:hypothetical protein